MDSPDYQFRVFLRDECLGTYNSMGFKYIALI